MMNKYVFWLSAIGLIGLYVVMSVSAIVGGWVNSPTDLYIHINHTADNNTRGLYEALERTAEQDIVIYSAADCQFITDRQEYWCQND